MAPSVSLMNKYWILSSKMREDLGAFANKIDPYFGMLRAKVM